MNPPSLRQRIRNTSLLLLGFAVILGALAVPEVRQLGRAIRETLYRNYLSIEAAQHMHAALWRLQLAERDGAVAAILPGSQAEFLHWIDVEEHDITEIGEAELAQDIDQRGRRLFLEVGGPSPAKANEVDFAILHQKLNQLIEMNRDAMFRADSRASRLGDRVTYEFVAGLIALLILGSVISWTLAGTVAKPLSELADRLRSFSLRGPALRLGEQPLAELQAVAFEFNKMAERLEQFEKLNVDRLIYEKSKTEAIIESLEDGVVLIDPAGTVTHINEIAAIILGVERKDALGSEFDDLDSNHPHYLRVRAALHDLNGPAHELHQVEVELRVRGRDHTYVLKRVPLPVDDGRALGTMLILQDITYLRDKDRARANLVATLSHELKTPLTSLALSAELLERRKANLDEKQNELVASVAEDVRRLRSLADNLLNLARGEVVAITLQGEPVDLGQLATSIAKTFAMQAEQKGVSLNVATGSFSTTITGDAVKLSWVVSNLLANALRYTPHGGAIALSAARLDDAVELKVTDTGPGIPSEVRDHLFKRFAQWSVNGAQPGSAGLGLAIAKEIVEAHGGRIFVESEVGEGTCFTVSLPVRLGETWPRS